jgi:hypothetical protein
VSFHKRNAVMNGAAFLDLANAGLFVNVAENRAFIRLVAHKIIPPGCSDTKIGKAVTAYVRDEVYQREVVVCRGLC